MDLAETEDEYGIWVSIIAIPNMDVKINFTHATQQQFSKMVFLN